jgi:hypothetical protein
LNQTKKRRGTRFPADLNALVRLQLAAEDAELVGLVIDESFEGCSGVFRKNPALHVGTSGTVTVGALAPVKGEVVWVRELEPGIVRVGFSLDVERNLRF